MTVDNHPVIILDLYFMSSSKVDTTVALLWVTELSFQFEVVKSLFCENIVAGLGID